MTKPKLLHLNQDTAEKLEEMAEAQRRSQSDVVRSAITSSYKEWKRRNAKRGKSQKVD